MKYRIIRRRSQFNPNLYMYVVQYKMLGLFWVSEETSGYNPHALEFCTLDSAREAIEYYKKYNDKSFEVVEEI